MLHRNVKVDHLSRVPLFAGCSRGDLRKVAAIADEVDLRQGKVLIREGERGREFFVLLEGAVEVTKGGRLVKTLGPGDFFGEIALVSDAPRTATVTATTPVDALVVTDRDFRRLLRDSPQIQAKVLRTLGDRLSELAGLGFL